MRPTLTLCRADCVAICTYHFTLGYFVKHDLHRRTRGHLGNAAKFLFARKMIELQCNRMGIVSTIYASTRKFYLLDNGQAICPPVPCPSVVISGSVGNTRTFHASPIVALAQAFSGIVPIMLTLTERAEVVMRRIKLWYSYHCSPPQSVGQAEGASNTARLFRATDTHRRGNFIGLLPLHYSTFGDMTP
jgi:hypothetical protein